MDTVRSTAGPSLAPTPPLWERIERWSALPTGLLFLGVSLPFWLFAAGIAWGSLRRMGTPAYDGSWAGDLLLKTYIAPPAIFFSLLGLALLDSASRTMSATRRRALSAALIALLFTPLALVVVSHAWKLLTFDGGPTRLSGDFWWQAGEWLFAAAVPAAVALDASRTVAWQRRRGLLIVGCGLLAWVWGVPLYLLLRTGRLDNWLWMAVLYAPLTLLAAGCLALSLRRKSRAPDPVDRP